MRRLAVCAALAAALSSCLAAGTVRAQEAPLAIAAEPAPPGDQ
jgi:hypothetical protein